MRCRRPTRGRSTPEPRREPSSPPTAAKPGRRSAADSRRESSTRCSSIRPTRRRSTRPGPAERSPRARTPERRGARSAARPWPPRCPVSWPSPPPRRAPSSSGPFREGFFRSTDGGSTWTAENDGFLTIGPQVLAIAADPTNPSVVYAAVGSDVYVSAKGGGQWQLDDYLAGFINGIAALAVDASGIAYIGRSAPVLPARSDRLRLDASRRRRLRELHRGQSERRRPRHSSPTGAPA